MLAPVMLLLAWYYPRPMLFGVCLILAFLSDVFDGILARRLNVATPGLRRLDSIADSTFYVAALSSKLWGIGLFIGFFLLLVRGQGGLFVGVPLYVGILVDVEGLAVSLVLKEWKSDVPSIVHAWRLRASRRLL